MRRIVELILAVKNRFCRPALSAMDGAQRVRKNRQYRKYVQYAGGRAIFWLKFFI
jgi:hypothetical protein